MAYKKVYLDSLGRNLPNGGSGGSMRSVAPNFVLERYRRETLTVEGVPPEPPAVNLPTSQTGILVPWFIGRQKVFSPNVIWYGNLRPITDLQRTTEVTDETVYIETNGVITTEDYVETSTVTETLVTTGYKVDMQFGVGLGEDVHLLGIEHNGITVWSGDEGPDRSAITPTRYTDLFQGGMVFSGGQFDQAPDTYLETVITTGVPGYVGVAHLICFDVSVSSSFGAVAFDVERVPNPLALPDADNYRDGDVSIATALVDIITSSWGGAGISLSKIDTAAFIAAAEVLAEEGNFCSLFIQQPSNSISVIGLLQEQAEAVVFEDPSTGLISIRLIRDTNIDVESLPLFDDSNVTEARDLSKSSWVSVINQLRGTFTDRSGNYGKGVAIAQNLALLSSGGKGLQSASVDYPAVMNKELATQLIARDLAKASVPLINLELQTNRDGAQLLPGEAIRFSWPDWGIVDFPLVIMRRREHPKESNQVTLLCRQLQPQASTVIFAEPDDSLFDPVDTDAVSPIQVEMKTAPFWLMYRAGFRGSYFRALTSVYPMILAEPFNSSQQNFDLYLDNMPNADQALALSQATYATVGELSSGISQYQDIADGIISSIQIESVTRADYLYNIGLAGVRQGRLLMFLNDEIFSFESVTNLGAGVWQLNNVHRALIDTAPMTHLANDTVYIIGNDYKWVSRTNHRPASDYLPEWTIVSRAFNVAQEVADGLSYTAWVPSERPNNPNRPHNLKIDANARSATPLPLTLGGTYTATWSSRSRQNINTLALTLDPAEALETVGYIQKHRVTLRDSANVLWDLGVTTGSGDDNDLGITIPAGAATGVGVIWAQAETPYGVSTYHDYLPVTLS